MGSGASKDQNGLSEEEEIDTSEFEPIKNWQGEVSIHTYVTKYLLCML